MEKTDNVIGSSLGTEDENMDKICNSDEDIQNNNHNLGSAVNRGNDNQNTQQFTNFSINEILKNSFGRKKSTLNRDVLFSAFTPVVSAEANILSQFSETYNRHINENKLNEKLQRPCASLSPTSTCSSPGSPSSVTSPVITSPDLDKAKLWPAWVYCTRYSDRPSSGPRSRKMKQKKTADEKRPRTAFTTDQLQKLKCEFEHSHYLTEDRRTRLSQELNLSESQIKIWFQNKRAKIKKTTSSSNPLAKSLMAQGLYNHSTVSMCDGEDVS